MTNKNEENYDWIKASADALIAEINEYIEDFKKSRDLITDKNCYMAKLFDGETDRMKKAISTIEEYVLLIFYFKHIIGLYPAKISDPNISEKVTHWRLMPEYPEVE